MAGKVDICGIDTSKLPVLSSQRMQELFKEIEQDAPEHAKNLSAATCGWFLSVVVQRFAHRGENADDLFQVGCIGLIKAIDHFDITQEVKFSTYAVPMIIGEIRRYLRDNNQIRVSRSLRDTAYKALQAREKLSNQKNTEPTIDEIAAELELPREDIVAALDAIQEPLSIFEPVYHDGADAIYVVDQMGDEKNTDGRWMESLALKDALSKLGKREQNILYLRYFQGRTQMEIAQDIGISQAQVSRLEKSALERMRKLF